MYHTVCVQDVGQKISPVAKPILQLPYPMRPHNINSTINPERAHKRERVVGLLAEQAGWIGTPRKVRTHSALGWQGVSWLDGTAHSSMANFSFYKKYEIGMKVAQDISYVWFYCEVQDKQIVCD